MTNISRTNLPEARAPATQIQAVVGNALPLPTNSGGGSRAREALPVVARVHTKAPLRGLSLALHTGLCADAKATLEGCRVLAKKQGTQILSAPAQAKVVPLCMPHGDRQDLAKEETFFVISCQNSNCVSG
ncbi:UNVERIFIED_CONTAM: hypothetical protein K2H54_008634 [Gekko kuhli]